MNAKQADCGLIPRAYGLLIGVLASCPSLLAADKPNIVVILADDLGYGDVACYNRDRGKIKTPNIDGLAARGVRFTDGHSSSGVCSPSRYALLTGRYHWRTRLQKGIVGTWERPLIDAQRLTVAGLLKQQGYRTACLGKWHLGWDWPIEKEKLPLFKGKTDDDESVSAEHVSTWRDTFSQRIDGGPTTRGFESYFGTDVPNWPPYCFIENDRTQGIPTEFLPSKLFAINQASVQGPALKDWSLEPILPELGKRASEFISSASKGERPYFLYLALTSPHTPLAVNEPWRGKSGLNDYADFVMETDHVIGHVLEAIERTGKDNNTLVLFTSDNGCAPYIGMPKLEKMGHFPSGPLRGYKSNAWEGGHRVPFIVRWPARVKSGAVCDQLVHQADLLATCAELLETSVPENAAEDSFSLLPLLTGKNGPIRETSVSQSSGGLLSIRRGQWKLILGPGSGGWGDETDGLRAQLYNLATDLGEKENLYARRPELAAEIMKLMEQVVNDGRSTIGAPQRNDVPVNWKQFLKL